MIRALPEQSTQGSRKDGKPASLGQAATPRRDASGPRQPRVTGRLVLSDSDRALQKCTGFQDPVFATGLDVFLVHIQGQRQVAEERAVAELGPVTVLALIFLLLLAPRPVPCRSSSKTKKPLA